MRLQKLEDRYKDLDKDIQIVFNEMEIGVEYNLSIDALDFINKEYSKLGYGQIDRFYYKFVRVTSTTIIINGVEHNLNKGAAAFAFALAFTASFAFAAGELTKVNQVSTIADKILLREYDPPEQDLHLRIIG